MATDFVDTLHDTVTKKRIPVAAGKATRVIPTEAYFGMLLQIKGEGLGFEVEVEGVTAQTQGEHISDADWVSLRTYNKSGIYEVYPLPAQTRVRVVKGTLLICQAELIKQSSQFQSGLTSEMKMWNENLATAKAVEVFANLNNANEIVQDVKERTAGAISAAEDVVANSKDVLAAVTQQQAGNNAATAVNLGRKTALTVAAIGMEVGLYNIISGPEAGQVWERLADGTLVRQRGLEAAARTELDEINAALTYTRAQLASGTLAAPALATRIWDEYTSLKVRSAGTGEQPNNVTTYAVSGGRLAERENSSAVSVEWAGVLGSDTVAGATTDSTAQVQAAWDTAFALGLPLYVPRFVRVSFLRPRGTEIYGPGREFAGFVQPAGAVGQLSARFCWYHVEGLHGVLDGLHAHDLSFHGQTESNGFWEHAHSVFIAGSKNARFVRCGFRAFRGDALYFGATDYNAQGSYHNTGFRVLDCDFDGVNNLNRNGVSVIDGSDGVIEGNTFKNLTRGQVVENGTTISAMPGAIDLEPDPHTPDSVIKDIYIGYNKISGCQGSGCITSQAGTTSRPIQMAERITIEGNTVTSSPNATYGIFLLAGQEGRTATLNQKYIVKDNIVSGVKRPLGLAGVRGVTLENNRFSGSEPSRIGDNAPSAAQQTEWGTATISPALITSRNNTYKATGSQYAVHLYGYSNFTSDSDLFVESSNTTDSAAFIVVAGATISETQIINPRTDGTFAKIIDQSGGVQVIPGGSNRLIANRSGMSRGTWANIMPLLTYRTVAPPTDVSATGFLEADLPRGLSFNVVNGAANLPNSASQGAFLTYIDDNATYGNAARGFGFQLFASRDNARGSWIRAAGSDGTWKSWQKLGYAAQTAPTAAPAATLTVSAAYTQSEMQAIVQRLADVTSLANTLQARLVAAGILV